MNAGDKANQDFEFLPHDLVSDEARAKLAARLDKMAKSNQVVKNKIETLRTQSSQSLKEIGKQISELWDDLKEAYK